MTSKGDISEELKLHRVKQNCHHLETIVLSINNTVNPIASTISKEHLFNIANGKAALGETTNILAKVWVIGFSARDCFIKDLRLRILCKRLPEHHQATKDQEFCF